MCKAKVGRHNVQMHLKSPEHIACELIILQYRCYTNAAIWLYAAPHRYDHYMFSCMKSHTPGHSMHISYIHACTLSEHLCTRMTERDVFDRGEQMKPHRKEKRFIKGRERAQQCQEIHSLRLNICDLLSMGTVTWTHMQTEFISPYV